MYPLVRSGIRILSEKQNININKKHFSFVRCVAVKVGGKTSGKSKKTYAIVVVVVFSQRGRLVATAVSKELENWTEL
jgi:hypothetical protein